MSSKPTSCEKSPSGPISSLIRPSKRPSKSIGVATRSPAPRRPASVRHGVDLGQRLHPAAYLDRLAQRFHPDPGRLAAGLGIHLLEPRGDRVERAMLRSWHSWASLSGRRGVQISRSRSITIPESAVVSASISASVSPLLEVCASTEDPAVASRERASTSLRR